MTDVADMPEVRRPTPEASASGQNAALTRWSRVQDRAAATAPARKGLRAKFEREVDPDGTLPPDERAYRADLAMRAHMARMRLAAAKKRRH